MSRAGAIPLSVCVPALDGARYLGEALRSVLDQSFGDFELLVVDDSSSDDTARVVAELRDDRLVSIRNASRLGLVGNWNRCLDLARGRYVSVFHQDDVMASDNLEIKFRFLEQHPSVGIVHSNVQQIDARGDLLSESWCGMPEGDHGGQHDGATYFERLVTGVNLVCAPSVVMRRECFERLGGFDPRLPFTADWEMWLRIALFYDIGYLTQALVRYRFHDRMETLRFLWSERLRQEYLAKILVLEKYPERVARADVLRRQIARVHSDRALAQFGRERGAGRFGSGDFLAFVMEVCADQREAGDQEGCEASMREVFDILASGRGLESSVMTNSAEMSFIEEVSWQAEAVRRQEVIERQGRWIDELGKAKRWLEEQQQNWEAEAARRQEVIDSQTRRIDEFEQARTWLQEQRQFWETEAGARQEAIAEERRRISEMEQAKVGLEGKARHWEAEAEKLRELAAAWQAVVTRWRKSRWVRIGRWLRVFDVG